MECLHTAAECCDGVETEITCLKRLQPPATESECLDSEGSNEENCPVESNSTDGAKKTVEKDSSLSESAPLLEVHLQEHGLDTPEDRVCLSSNTGQDYCQERQKEEKDPPVVSTHSLNLCDRSEEAQSEAEGTSLTVGILPPAVSDKQSGKTDKGEAVIREGQEATKGEDRSEQESKDSTAKEAKVVRTPSRNAKALVMGQTASSEGSEVSESPGSKEKTECKGLTPGDLPNPSPTDCGDVIEESESAAPKLLIEGLHEGEPPPDINSLEQNQETAGRDYAPEQQKGLAPKTSCHSGNCTGKVSSKEVDGKDAAEPSGYCIDKSGNPADYFTASDSMEDKRIDHMLCESSPEIMPSSGITHDDPDSAMAQSLSSDDEGSFRSVGSSTTEISPPSQDSVTRDDQDLPKVQEAQLSSRGFNSEELNYVKPDECSEHSVNVEAELSFDPAAPSALMDCNQPGTNPESQLSHSLQTMEALNSGGTEEKLIPELSKEDLSLGPALSQSENGDNNGCDLIAETQKFTGSLVSEPGPSVAEENKLTDISGKKHQLSVAGVVASAERSRDVLKEPQQEEQDNSKSSSDEGLNHSENQTTVLSSQSVTPGLDGAGGELLFPTNDASSEPVVENEMTDYPETLAVDAASQSHSRANQGEQTLV